MYKENKLNLLKLLLFYSIIYYKLNHTNKQAHNININEYLLSNL